MGMGGREGEGDGYIGGGMGKGGMGMVWEDMGEEGVGGMRYVGVKEREDGVGKIGSRL